ncbi:DUF6939 family protein [Tenacibaculum maritimum]|uniref:DUF6939 family protein n=1 Tax=Tenacibaculum maritimum TaxID=107401 RepID=UPI0012E5788F|nr:hypothetical protein [Tenacibaculum maritimum]MCD9563188.1 hypothetical protein [Tenacibaculum maritimum]MCD9566441.1 hypothetical protein [Tenacibaculum maritimum]MCD9579826.1 hypothetical protein [Tenacibaculum maritimum]MCD9585577.1 hypothetical protein [Tenacibaculum maritimum]MCD9597216.1 hypothetical protein [Tenacibaculum maritimum]
MNIKIVSRRRSLEKLSKENPYSVIIDVTSKSDNDYVMLSPFYPHGNIPIPFSENIFSESVEGVWQGLKTFENHNVDLSKFKVSNMKGIKRTVRKYGYVIGHRKGVNGKEILDYYQARVKIYLPTYEWVLKNKATHLIEKITQLSLEKDVILLDYETNSDIKNLSKPLSHAYLIKYYIENNHSFENLNIS